HPQIIRPGGVTEPKSQMSISSRPYTPDGNQPLALRLSPGNSGLQPVPEFPDPALIGQRIGTERLQITFLLVIEERTVEPEIAGFRCLNQAGRVIGTHLKEDTHLKLPERFPAQGAI